MLHGTKLGATRSRLENAEEGGLNRTQVLNPTRRVLTILSSFKEEDVIDIFDVGHANTELCSEEVNTYDWNLPTIRDCGNKMLGTISDVDTWTHMVFGNI